MTRKLASLTQIFTLQRVFDGVQDCDVNGMCPVLFKVPVNPENACFLE